MQLFDIAGIIGSLDARFTVTTPAPVTLGSIHEYTILTTPPPPPPPTKRKAIAVPGVRGLGGPFAAMINGPRLAMMIGSGDFEGATIMLGGMDPAQRADVVAEAIALGADPAMIAPIMSIFGEGEVITIIGKAPRRKPSRLPLVLLALGGVGLSVFVYRRWR